MNKTLKQWVGETREDRISLAQGYLGVFLLIGFYYFGLYKQWWAF